MTRRVVSLYLPSWPTDHWRRAQASATPPAKVPVVATGRVGARKVVVDADRAARALGVHPGLAVAQAQARVPGLLVVEHAPAEDAAALERIALWALRRYSPLVAVDGAIGLWIDASGVAHLFGGEAELLQDLIGRLARAGAHARAAMADTAGAAWALARFGTGKAIVSARGQAGPDLDPLPLAALRLQAEAVEGLGKLSMETIGDLERTPRAPLALRFGPTLTRRLDQARGRTAETFEPISSPELVRVRRPFFEPIGAPETIQRKTEDLVERLCRELEEKGLGARKIDLICERVDGRREAVRIGTAAPLRDPKRLIRLFRDRLGHIDPGFGIEAMSIAAPLTEPLAPAQGIFGEWWRRDAEVEAVRDYFSVEDEAGERFWLFRQGDGEIAHTGDLSWFLHGLFA